MTLSEKEIKDFFSSYEIYKAVNDALAAQGVNNYNLFTSLLKKNDEVRLHSNFIYSMINPNGGHCQGSKFLELYLDTIGLSGFIDVSNARTFKEKGTKDLRIDLLVHDGEHYLIIENKLDAVDQAAQIRRYIEYVKESFSQPADSDIKVVYLSKNKDKPSKESLGGLTLTTGLLSGDIFPNDVTKKDTVQDIQYINQHYHNHIRVWVEKCLDYLSSLPAGNCSNLLFAFQQYRDVLDMLFLQYKGTLMTLEDHFSGKKGSLKMAMEIEEGLPKLKNNLLRELFEKMDDKVSSSRVKGNRLPSFASKPKETLAQHSDIQFYLTDKKDRVNKGFFWEVQDSLGNTIYIVLFYGKTLLHLGIVDDSLQTPAPIDGRLKKIKDWENRSSINNNQFKSLISWACPVDEAIQLFSDNDRAIHTQLNDALINLLDSI